MIYAPLEDSYLLSVQVKKYSKNRAVLDLGTGSGILAKTANDSGAKSVLASDINPAALEELKKSDNSIKTIKSNLFSKIIGKFDLIIFNPPYLPEDKKEDKESAQTTTGGRNGDEIILRFLKKAPKHLNNNGIMLLLLSSLTPRARINRLMKKLSLKYRIITNKKFFFEELYILKITIQ